MAGTSELSALVSRLEAVTTKLEGIAAGGGGGGDAPSAEFLTAYDDQITNGENTVKFLSLGAHLDGEVAEQIALYKEALKKHREFLELVAKYKAPSQAKFAELIKPLANQMAAVVEYFEKRRASRVINNLQAMKEGIQSLGWITMSPKPAPYVKQGMDSAQFYTNRILVEFKGKVGKDQNQVVWAKSYIASINDLQKYVKQHHTTGPSWNKNGADPDSAGVSSGAGAPPPPPPPAVLPPSDVPAVKTKDNEAGRAELFAAINKGGAVTSGLRKVTDGMKTHKNPALRAGSKVEVKEKKPASAPKTAAASTVKKAPVCELQGKKWVVEYQVDNKDIVINAANFHQSVYVFRCERSTIKVNGKVNFIALDNCKKVAVAFDGVVSSLEVMNCQSIQAQVMHQLPTLSIDKTDGCQVYLSKESLTCEIITAKSSEMNILIPDKSGEFSEHAVAEQFRTKWNGSKLVTTATDING